MALLTGFNARVIKDRSKSIIKGLDILFLVLSLGAIASLVAQYGFYLSVTMERWFERMDIIIVHYFVLHYILKLILVEDRLDYLKKHWFQGVLVVLIISQTVLIINTLGIDLIQKYFSNLNVSAITRLTIIYVQIIILLSVISAAIRYNRKIASLRFHPAQTILMSFLLVILVGTVLLQMPRASATGETIGFLDALFTSTSATCVTGLIVVDTGSYFSLTGQIIILMLIQIGGLGIMTLSSFLAMFFGQGVGIRERVLLQEMMNIDRLGMITSSLRNAVLLTFSFEAIGSIMLFFSWNHPDWSMGERIYHSVFHSISAFCNAGFSLNSDSLMSYSHNYPVLLTIAVLIIFGGLGFVVIMELGGARVFSANKSAKNKKWSVQTKLVVLISTILLVAGTFVIFILESSDGSVGDRLMQAFFSSVTARTAGFNTLDFARLSMPATLLILILMFIGASPGSTGGGIKTTTLGVLFGSLYSIITGHNKIKMFNRNVSFTVLNRALVVFAFSITVIAVSTFFLSITENAQYLDILFEEISAFGTVGLSRGLTPNLTGWGRFIIILTMFIGRIGTLTLAFAITTPKENQKIEYPTERNIMIG